MPSSAEIKLYAQLVVLRDELQSLYRALSESATLETGHREKIQFLLASLTALLQGHADTSLEESIAPSLLLAHESEIVLLVEDDDGVRALLKRRLEDEAKTVLEALNGEEALKLAELVIPDLIISDVIMNGMDGFQLCRHFKSQLATSHIPIVLLTARNDLEDKLAGLEVGADDYLYKPFNIAELLLRVKNLLAQRRNLREAFSRQFALSVPAPVNMLVIPSENPFLAQVRAAIERNLADETYSVDRLAYDVFLSRVQLYRKLKSLSGCSPLELIVSIRLARAAELLKSRSMSISEISEAVGFGENQSHFARRFKERFGVSPSDFAEPD
jgi:DNA-binding response OmpR family regulator